MPTRSGRCYEPLFNCNGVRCTDRQQCRDGPCRCWVVDAVCSFCTSALRVGYPDDGGRTWGGEWKTPRKPNGRTWVGPVCWQCYLSYNVCGDAGGDAAGPFCGDFARFRSVTTI